MTDFLDPTKINLAPGMVEKFGEQVKRVAPWLGMGLAVVSIGGTQLQKVRHQNHVGNTAGDDAVKAAAIAAGAVGLSALTKRGPAAGLMGPAFFAAYTGLRMHRALASRRRDKGREMASLVGTTAAGVVGYSTGRELGKLSLSSLATNINLNHSQQAIAWKVEQSVAEARKASPILAELLTKEVAGIAGALITIPVAHAVIKRALSMNRRRISDQRETSFLGSQMYSQAGEKDGGYEPSQVDGPLRSLTGTLNLRGNIFTSYNQENATRVLLGR